MLSHLRQHGKISCWAMAGLTLFFCGPQTSAQFLRLGPFDFDAMTRLEAIYTTNVEQERPSEATADREDFYLIWGLDLASSAFVAPNTTIRIDTGIAIEKHFNRTDLDNSEAPFGRFSISIDSDWDPLKVYARFLYERTSESVDDRFVPTEIRKRRQVGTTMDSMAGADWSGRILQFGASYQFLQERFDDDRFAGEENDEKTFIYYVQLQPIRTVRLRYEIEQVETDFVNRPGDITDETTETITINFDEAFGLLERPKVTYSIGIEREQEDGESEGWDLIHMLSITDEFDLSSTISLKGFATYEYKQEPKDDDISLQYGITLAHDISATAQQSFTATRKPVETLGSTDDTTETEFAYRFTKRDFLIYNLEFSFSGSYRIDEPIIGEKEETLEYNVGLVHSAAISRSLTRRLSYMYSRESSNIEDEILDEHRVALSYEYQF